MRRRRSSRSNSRRIYVGIYEDKNGANQNILSKGFPVLYYYPKGDNDSMTIIQKQYRLDCWNSESHPLTLYRKLETEFLTCSVFVEISVVRFFEFHLVLGHVSWDVTKYVILTGLPTQLQWNRPGTVLSNCVRGLLDVVVWARD